MVLIPVYLVPLSIMLHLASLMKLQRVAVQAPADKNIARASA